MNLLALNFVLELCPKSADWEFSPLVEYCKSHPWFAPIFMNIEFNISLSENYHFRACMWNRAVNSQSQIYRKGKKKSERVTKIICKAWISSHLIINSTWRICHMPLLGIMNFWCLPQGPLLIINLGGAPGLGCLNIVWTQHRDGCRGINSQKTAA